MGIGNLTRSKALAIGLGTMLILLVLFVFLQNQVLQREVFALREEQAAYEETVAEAEAYKRDLELQLSECRDLSAQFAGALSASKARVQELENVLEQAHLPEVYVLEMLNDAGFEDEEAFLGTLVDHPELIPYKGVLGGTMQWWPVKCRVLNEKWVLGYFEDGHIGGYAWLRYKVYPGAYVEWSLESAFLMGE